MAGDDHRSALVMHRPTDGPAERMHQVQRPRGRGRHHLPVAFRQFRHIVPGAFGLQVHQPGAHSEQRGERTGPMIERTHVHGAHLLRALELKGLQRHLCVAREHVVVRVAIVHAHRRLRHPVVEVVVRERQPEGMLGVGGEGLKHTVLQHRAGHRWHHGVHITAAVRAVEQRWQQAVPRCLEHLGRSVEEPGIHGTIAQHHIRQVVGRGIGHGIHHHLGLHTAHIVGPRARRAGGDGELRGELLFDGAMGGHARVPALAVSRKEELPIEQDTLRRAPLPNGPQQVDGGAGLGGRVHIRMKPR